MEYVKSTLSDNVTEVCCCENLLINSSEAYKLAGKRLFYAVSDLFQQLVDDKIFTESASYKLYMNGDDLDLVKFLITLDYFSYVPFGMSGYNELRQRLDEKGENISLEDFKFNTMIQVLKIAKITYSPQTEQFIKRYCDEFFQSRHNVYDPIGLAIVSRRVSGEIENLVVCEKIRGILSKNEKFETIMDGLSKNLENDNKTFDIDKNMQPEKFGPLSESQKEYFDKILGDRLK